MLVIIGHAHRRQEIQSCITTTASEVLHARSPACRVQKINTIIGTKLKIFFEIYGANGELDEDCPGLRHNVIKPSLHQFWRMGVECNTSSMF